MPKPDIEIVPSDPGSTNITPYLFDWYYAAYTGSASDIKEFRKLEYNDVSTSQYNAHFKLPVFKGCYTIELIPIYKSGNDSGMVSAIMGNSGIPYVYSKHMINTNNIFSSTDTNISAYINPSGSIANLSITTQLRTCNNVKFIRNVNGTITHETVSGVLPVIRITKNTSSALSGIGLETSSKYLSIQLQSNNIPSTMPYGCISFYNDTSNRYITEYSGTTGNPKLLLNNKTNSTTINFPRKNKSTLIFTDNYNEAGNKIIDLSFKKMTPNGLYDIDYNTSSDPDYDYVLEDSSLKFNYENNELEVYYEYNSEASYEVTVALGSKKYNSSTKEIAFTYTSFIIAVVDKCLQLVSNNEHMLNNATNTAIITRTSMPIKVIHGYYDETDLWVDLPYDSTKSVLELTPDDVLVNINDDHFDYRSSNISGDRTAVVSIGYQDITLENVVINIEDDRPINTTINIPNQIISGNGFTATITLGQDVAYIPSAYNFNIKLNNEEIYTVTYQSISKNVITVSFTPNINKLSNIVFGNRLIKPDLNMTYNNEVVLSKDFILNSPISIVEPAEENKSIYNSYNYKVQAVDPVLLNQVSSDVTFTFEADAGSRLMSDESSMLSSNTFSATGYLTAYKVMPLYHGTYTLFFSTVYGKVAKTLVVVDPNSFIVSGYEQNRIVVDEQKTTRLNITQSVATNLEGLNTYSYELYCNNEAELQALNNSNFLTFTKDDEVITEGYQVQPNWEIVKDVYGNDKYYVLTNITFKGQYITELEDNVKLVINYNGYTVSIPIVVTEQTIRLVTDLTDIQANYLARIHRNINKDIEVLIPQVYSDLATVEVITDDPRLEITPDPSRSWWRVFTLNNIENEETENPNKIINVLIKVTLDDEVITNKRIRTIEDQQIQLLPTIPKTELTSYRIRDNQIIGNLVHIEGHQEGLRPEDTNNITDLAWYGYNIKADNLGVYPESTQYKSGRSTYINLPAWNSYKESIYTDYWYNNNGTKTKVVLNSSNGDDSIIDWEYGKTATATDDTIWINDDEEFCAKVKMIFEEPIDIKYVNEYGQHKIYYKLANQSAQSTWKVLLTDVTGIWIGLQGGGGAGTRGNYTSILLATDSFGSGGGGSGAFIMGYLNLKRAAELGYNVRLYTSKNHAKYSNNLIDWVSGANGYPTYLEISKSASMYYKITAGGGMGSREATNHQGQGGAAGVCSEVEQGITNNKLFSHIGWSIGRNGGNGGASSGYVAGVPLGHQPGTAGIGYWDEVIFDGSQNKRIRISRTNIPSNETYINGSGYVSGGGGGGASIFHYNGEHYGEGGTGGTGEGLLSSPGTDGKPGCIVIFDPIK